MVRKYRVGNQHVDPSRNQITCGEVVQTLAPKALSVLTLLAKRKGSVVTQEELLDSVWKNTVVNHNTLQRSIAQIRKAFGDDAKQQRVIKTHSKQGYSLELEVCWQEDTAESEELTKPKTLDSKPITRARPSMLAIGAIVLALLLGATTIFTQFKSEQGFSISSIQAMTATDNKEFDAIYSADGEYIIFNRYHEKLCRSRIWAKNLSTQQEILLTEWGNHSSLSLSPDGKQLAFIERERCQPPLPAKPCFALKSFNLQKALTGNTIVSTLMSCNTAQIRQPHWLSNQDLVLMHKPGNHWQLLKFSIADAVSEILYQPGNGNLLYFDLAPSMARIALITLNEFSQPVLEILTTDGDLISSNLVQEHPDIPKFRLFYPRFVPNESSLMFSTGRQLFSLSYTGEVQRIMLPLDEAMSTPLFGVDGKTALATKGTYDSDIGTIDLSKINNSPDDPILEIDLVNLARSNSGEREAILQPDGNIIAFESARSGNEQLWLSKDGVLTQLSNLPLDTRIEGFRWASDGKSLLLNSDGRLFEIQQDGSEQSISINEPVTDLFHWNSETKTSIANMLIRGRRSLAKLNLETGEYVQLKDGPVLWAAESTAGRLVYLDHNNQYWQSQAAEDTLITPLNTHGSDKRFILAGETIYGVNEDFKLWTYDLDQQVFTLMSTLPQNIDYLTDIHNDKLMLTYVVAAKKEIVELTLNDLAN